MGKRNNNRGRNRRPAAPTAAKRVRSDRSRDDDLQSINRLIEATLSSAGYLVDCAYICRACAVTEVYESVVDACDNGKSSMEIMWPVETAFHLGMALGRSEPLDAENVMEPQDIEAIPAGAEHMTLAGCAECNRYFGCVLSRKSLDGDVNSAWVDIRHEDAMHIIENSSPFPPKDAPGLMVSVAERVPV